MTAAKYLYGSRYEKDYLIRTVGSIVREPDVALTELVANASDAGAAEIKITIPTDFGGELRVEDDGSGMTPDEFRYRWMTMSYDRRRHQDGKVDWPPGRAGSRVAYGRAGVGRHGLLCFSDRYRVVTRKNGTVAKFDLAVAEGEDPFVIVDEGFSTGDGHGTELITTVERSLPQAETIRQILTSRFVFDPSFKILVNGIALTWADLQGKVDERMLKTPEGHEIEVTCFDSSKAAPNTLRSGVAIWVNRRLVGDPSWNIGRFSPIDGRTHFAKRYTVVARCDALLDDVLPDWSALGKSPRVDSVCSTIADYVAETCRQFSAYRIDETATQVLRNNFSRIEPLSSAAQHEVVRVVEKLTEKNPSISVESLDEVVEALVAEKQSKSAKALWERIRNLPESDIEGLERILSDWTVADLEEVIGVVDHRIAVIRAIEMLSGDAKTDELHTLHPLVTDARWLFGPEFESAEYTSNTTIRKAVERIFGERLQKADFFNHLRRPDLVLLADSSLSAVGLDEFDSQTGLSTMRRLLIIEVKRGKFPITTKEMDQARDYIRELVNCGVIEKPFDIRAFVVGDSLAPGTEPVAKYGEPTYARVEAVTYDRLTRTAGKRLFGLKERLDQRYSSEERMPERLRRIVAQGVQAQLDLQSATPPAA